MPPLFGGAAPIFFFRRCVRGVLSFAVPLVVSRLFAAPFLSARSPRPLGPLGSLPRSLLPALLVGSLVPLAVCGGPLGSSCVASVAVRLLGLLGSVACPLSLLALLVRLLLGWLLPCAAPLALSVGRARAAPLSLPCSARAPAGRCASPCVAGGVSRLSAAPPFWASPRPGSRGGVAQPPGRLADVCQLL